MAELAPLLAAWLVMFTMLLGIWVGWTLCSFFGARLPWLDDEEYESESGETDDA